MIHLYQNALKQNVIPNEKLCYWELTQNTSFWSHAFIKRLGYDLDDITVKLDFFLDEIIHINNVDAFRDNFYNLIRHNIPFKQNLMLRTKNGKYLDFVCLTDDDLDSKYGKPNSNNIYFFKSKINTHQKVRGSNFYYLETAKMTSTGSWYIDFESKKSYWDNITRNILEYPKDFIPSLKMGLSLYVKEHQDMVTTAFYECSFKGKPFDLEIKMISAKKRQFWARAMGKPVYNNEQEIIGIRGVFQDIDNEKQKELKIEKHTRIIQSQNSRLFNFAHIVSHNLRSHSSNLALVTQLINDTEDVNEKLELIENLASVSESLNDTITHLNEVVTIHSKTNKTKELVSFEETINRVCNSINQIIDSNNAKITTNFNVKQIDYIPAYMESIMLNFITNAIKYKHPERPPIIEINTFYTKNNTAVMEISDNGLGIDLEQFGDKLFGMYKTFHYNQDAVGIGLFMTKNQIESLNGSIEVESQIDVGTTFKIYF